MRQNRSALERYRKNEIDVYYLIKTEHETYSEKAEKVLGDGVYVTIEQLENVKEAAWKEYEVPFYKNARRLVTAEEYECGIQMLLKEGRKLLASGNYRRVLVLGTEEFMYPALRLAAEVEKTVPCVMCHSTTRSPITVSSEDNYPLQRRYEIKSFYDCKRRTFIYNLENYDYVMIVTDAQEKWDEFCKAMETGDAPAAEKVFTFFLKNGILLGLMMSRDTWLVSSNHENGDGYSDIHVEINNNTAFVAEVKYAENDALEEWSEKAMEQIEKLRYAEELKELGFETVYAYGIACYKKYCKIICKKI